MKICLLTCSASFLIDEKVFPPLGLLAVGTALRSQGHKISIGSIPSNNTNYFALGPTTPEYASALDLLRQIKSQNRKNKVVIGGHHAASNVEDCLANGFDVVALGDGENITLGTFESVGVVNLGRKLLSEYPISDRGLINIRNYRYMISGRQATTVVTSRGCPYHCGFCSQTENQVRYRTPESIEHEVAYLKGFWGYNAIMFFDDTFIVNKERVSRICDTLRKYGILWRCFVRGDLVVKHGQELIDLMHNSGCVEVGMGIESGSDKILQTIRKGETTSTLQEAIRMLHVGGIRVKGFFIIGLPGESQDTLAETRAFLQKSRLDAADFAIYQPFRGSPIWDNWLDYDISWEGPYTGQNRFYKGRSGEYDCLVSTSTLSHSDITKARDELERSFQCQ